MRIKNSRILFIVLTCSCLMAGLPSTVLSFAGFEIRVGGDLQLRKCAKQHGEVFLFEVLRSKGKVIGHGCIASRIDDPGQKGQPLHKSKRDGVLWVYLVGSRKVSFVGRTVQSLETPAISLGIEDPEFIRNPELFLDQFALKKGD